MPPSSSLLKPEKPADSTPRPPSKRRIDSVERFARLPVWPVWNGVFLFVISRILGKDIAAKLEDAIGGRVCPNFYQDTEKTSPFIMLVHHRHSFAAWDPLRYIQRTFFPEGFPSHPHRGFITVTYFLRGGFTHRDSMGVQQRYGAEERHDGKHTQYLMTGSGLLHEEMFDLQADNAFGVSGQELYQLWLNVPAKNKMDSPFIQVLGGEDETPSVVNSGVETIVIAGTYQDHSASARLFSEVSIFHVKMEPTSTWKYTLPSSHATGILYIRTGSVSVDDETVGPHNTIYLTSFGDEVIVTTENGADFLFLSGAPLMEPVAAQGSMVMNSAYDINEAYQDYQAGKMGAPWDHKLTDKEWKDHVNRYPSIYR
ncbi:Putative quercetin 2,3-dioxygenase [Seminavis robusta]|uniref:Quercetin 2,3-dioxygenase n=1 Tax=Seminavis robusta TaxID=568900 RepID=A0A9N8DLS9_9STRA|nr:Putative quercetin 2,3-dioxygenase [Seminavis robusta]|eukprot:Sro155_g070380.1 Putative quercetin 2,3-dioxygenase (369) ;mRNA; f:27341-28447